MTVFPRSPQLEKALARTEDPTQPKINNIKKNTDGPNPRTNGESKAIQTKSHPEAYTYTLTKKGKGEKLIYPAPKVHLLNLG